MFVPNSERAHVPLRNHDQLKFKHDPALSQGRLGGGGGGEGVGAADDDFEESLAALSKPFSTYIEGDTLVLVDAVSRATQPALAHVAGPGASAAALACKRVSQGGAA